MTFFKGDILHNKHARLCEKATGKQEQEILLMNLCGHTGLSCGAFFCFVLLLFCF